eukprot:m.70563 g.70563  ORF g.70563 m.70563 type:complete len:137 (+) comp12263_c0_seq8:101-511(+)
MAFSFQVTTPTDVHGITSWFDSTFDGSQEQVHLSTSPFTPTTHWYQVRCLVKKPIFVYPGENVTGMLKMTINKFQSYDIHLELAVEGDVSRKAQGNLFLKEPNFRFMQFGAPPSMAPTDIAPPSQDAPVQVQQSSQ